MRAEAIALAVLLALSAGAASAQEWPTRTSLDLRFQDEGDEPDAEEVPAEEEARLSPLVASAWCIVKSSDEKPPADDDTDAEGGEDAAEPGCDVGLGIALARWRRLAWVAVAGSETIGSGLAWIPYQPKSGPVIAVALGLVARYDEHGIEPKLRLAIGATLSFGRRIAEE